MKKHPKLASEYVPELPLYIMKVPCNKLLGWWSLREILKAPEIITLIRKTSSMRIAPPLLDTNSSYYQRRENFLCSTARNRESTMCTSITCCQSLAEIIGWLPAWGSQLNRKIGILLFLL